MNKFNICIFLFGIFIFTKVHSQATIGSEINPNKGAILDLKENTNLLENSTKGLALPRVILLNSTPPLNRLAESIGAKSGVTPWDVKLHTGLVIYSIKCNASGVSVGPYVWTGTEWEPLLEDEQPSPEVKYYTDDRTQA